jgi:hypothetical protein
LAENDPPPGIFRHNSTGQNVERKGYLFKEMKITDVNKTAEVLAAVNSWYAEGEDYPYGKEVGNPSKFIQRLLDFLV